MLYYRLLQNKLKTNIKCYLKWYAKVVRGNTIDLEGLVQHMTNHNLPYSEGTIRGVLTDMVGCILELVKEGNTVQLPGLASFYINIKSAKGCEDPTNYRPSEYVECLRLRVIPLGDFTSTNLTTTLKRSSLDESAKANTSADDEDLDDGPLPDAQE
jgi:nucleoid DNA-binding protein